MEATSCSLLNSFRIINSTNSTNKFYYETPARIHHKLSNFPSFSTTFPSLNFPGKFLHTNGGFTAFCSTSPNKTQNPSQELALLLEVDGILVDAYRLGNRQAFNVAFQKLGLDCANWSVPVYTDLLRKSAGDEERMLVLFFNRIGWPTSLPTNEKETFVTRVLREKKNAFNEFLVSKDVPLRPGVEEFIDEAYNEGIPVMIISAYSKSGDKIARAVIEKLGHERISKIKIVGNQEVEQSLYGQVVLGMSSDTDEQLATEARKAVSAQKQKIAEEVASMLKLSVDIDTTSPESLDKIVAALRAGAEYAGKPVQNCVLISGSQSGVAGAQRIGMPCVVLRSSLISRAEFPSANAIMDGFGGADLTISKLRNKQWS
ncbi:CBBY-like protein [Pistacia vera]|uniref:CBBY-like protein n=1 Tax=Pistacia vera TaxID=55513 RepID=UPI001263D8B4|nr:CBBY-like protein [Pistacia vera]XP_031269891.1 CBBY-like protein [Pistacia vera]